MTTDLECQELQKRGERKRERERERKKERERHPTDVYASLFVLFHSHSLLSSCSLFTCASLSLSLSRSLSLSACACTNVDVYWYVVLYSCLPPLSFTLSRYVWSNIFVIWEKYVWFDSLELDHITRSHITRIDVFGPFEGMATIQGLWWLGHHHADLHSENILREHLQNRSSGHIYNASRISPISGESFTHTQLHIYI